MDDRDDEFLEEENDSLPEEREDILDEEDPSFEDDLENEPADDFPNLPSEEDSLREQSEPVPEGAGADAGKYIWTTLKGVVSKHPQVVLGAGVLIFFLVLIFFISGYGGISGRYDYIAPKCSNMQVRFGEDRTQTLSMEQYIISHIYSATKDMRSPDRDLYRTLAIVINTEVQSSGNCSRTYIPEVDDLYEFEILDAQSDLYEQIKTDIKEVKDLVMVSKETKQYYATSLDGFCYREIVYTGNSSDVTVDEDSAYILPQAAFEFPSSWVEEHVPWHFSHCPCNSPADAEDIEACYEEEWNYPSDEEPDLIYVDGGSGVGVSIYGAYYLTTFDGLSYESTLREFYPNRDWELASNDSSLLGRKKKKDCTGGVVPFNSTPLSRNEFISLVTDFLSSGLSNGTYASWAQYFIDYAGDIYDMGEEKNINPELIYIWARKEQGFTNNSYDTNHYNYYGYGHCNTCAHGTEFPDFMTGVETIYDYFVNKGSLENVAKTYSYLGDILYNFDDAKEMGLGGCYYMQIIYGDDYARCSNGYYCEAYYDSSGKVVGHSSSCVETTQEEKDAYIQWQLESVYVRHRQDIFKLGKETCAAGDVSVEANLNIPTQQLKEPLSTFLTEHDASISELNTTIRDNVVDAGVGTRAGVVTAVNTLINYLATYDVRIPYRYGGNHGYAATTYDGRNVNKPITTFYGVDPDWGTPITGAGKYTHYGPDCSSLVNWAMRNGGMKNIYDFTSQGYGDKGVIHAMNGSYVGQVGDVLFSDSHIQLVVSVEDGYYITAESQTNVPPYKPEFKGISYNQMNFATDGYRIVDLTPFYENASYHYSESEYLTRFDQGVLS